MLRHYLRDDGNLFIVSSDFAHWGEHYKCTEFENEFFTVDEFIESVDKECIRNIESID